MANCQVKEQQSLAPLLQKLFQFPPDVSQIETPMFWEVHLVDVTYNQKKKVQNMRKYWNFAS